MLSLWKKGKNKMEKKQLNNKLRNPAFTENLHHFVIEKYRNWSSKISPNDTRVHFNGTFSSFFFFVNSGLSLLTLFNRDNPQSRYPITHALKSTPLSYNQRRKLFKWSKYIRLERREGRGVRQKEKRMLNFSKTTCCERKKIRKLYRLHRRRAMEWSKEEVK